MSIDVKEMLEKKKKTMVDNFLESMVEYDENNYELKVSLVNIDSRFRNRIPKNIIEYSSNLSNNSIIVNENSNIIKIKYNNNNFNIGDRIIIKNVKGNSIMIRNAIYLYNRFNYFLININNHNIKKKYIENIDYKIKISINDIITNNDRMIGNMPINSIIGIHSIYILDYVKDNIISNDNINKILEILNISRTELVENYIFVQLPFIYSNENRLNNNIVFEEFQSINKIFNIEFQNIGGIPINYINADYPINNNQLLSSHEIIDIDTEYLYISIPLNGQNNEIGGGNNIYISKIINTIEGYPNANNYTIDLKKSFTNIVRMELVTSEIPYIDFNIRNNINNINNKIHWKYFEDGEYVYETSIPEGNYNPTSLIERLKIEMNKIERIDSTNENPKFSIFDITFDNNSQEIKFFSFKKSIVPNSLSLEKDINIGTNVLKLNIKQSNNFVNVGDTIIISNSSKIGDIPVTVINKSHTVYEVNRATDIYTVLINIDVEKNFEDINITGSGGQNVSIQIPARVSFQFNYKNSIGSILGFKNVGSENSITPYLHINSNYNDYIEPIIYDEVGNTNPSNSLINLNGNNYYMLLYLNDFEGVIMNRDFDNPFSKILLVGNSGDIMFNTFINSPLEFDIPVSSLEQLKVKFMFPDGSLPDFRNFDHSFTLRIVEKITKPYNTRINPNKTTYEKTLIDLYK